MANTPRTDKLIEQVKREREHLARQIEQSRETIKRSQQLLAQLDHMLVRLSQE